ncbi:MAG: hypothetical protein ABMB14_23665 [Myxococcota bacterium]
MMARPVWLVGLAIACGGEGGAGPVAEASIVPLTPVEHLLRASMAVRGIRPSVAELDAIEADPDALPGLVEGWLDSDEFGATIEDLHAELYELRADTNYQLPVMGPLEERGYNQADLHRSTVDAPVKLVREVVLADRPYTEILTADYTVANDVVAAIYGLAYDPNGPEWQHTHWIDGRPQSGLLSDSEMWRRHVSNAANFHRGRANFVSRTFLCEDIGARDVFVAGGVDISDEFAVAEAVSTQTGCVGCHNVIDPMAAFFWGYKEQLKRGAILSAYELNCEWDWTLGPPPMGDYRIEHWCYPLKFYDVSEEGDWSYWHLRPPGFFGEPGSDMADLGRMIAADPRFAECTARTFAAYLTETDREAIPDRWAGELRDVFVDSGYSAKALVEAIVLSEPFSAAKRTPGVPGPDAAFVAGLQLIRPEQASRTIRDLTGFQWLANQDYPGCELYGNNCWGAVDLATTDVYGFRSMMGGIDSYTVLHPTHTPTPTGILAQRKLADEAAGFAVLAESSVDPSSRRLVTGAAPTDADETVVRAQIVAWFRRMFAETVTADDPDVDAVYALFSAASARAGDPKEGWRVVLSTLFQDPSMVFY